jgi:hypothetical protein
MSINERDLPKGPVGFSFTTRVRMGDYEGELQLTAASLNDLRKAVRLLPEAHIEPVRSATAWQTTPTGEPICPKHGVPMRKRERQGDTWFSHNAGSEGEELWCRGYPGKDSPGWER